MQIIHIVYLKSNDSLNALKDLLEKGYKVITATPVVTSYARPSGQAVETEKIIYVLESKEEQVEYVTSNEFQTK